MRKRFVPSHYYRELQQKLQGLTQGVKSVEDYYKEMELAMMRANIEEDQEATLARFMGGLNREIANIVELHHYIDLEEMVYMAIKVERQLKKKTVSRFSSGPSSSWKPRWGNEKRDGTTSRFQSEPPKLKEDSAFKPKPKTDSPPSKNRDIKCFKCLGSGHIASQCPNKRVMLMTDCGEVITDDESDGEVEDNMPSLVEDSDEELEAKGKSLVARRVLSAQAKVDDMEQ